MGTTGATVCLIDDELEVLRVTRNLLELGGHPCRCFASPEDYLDDHRAADECVITDYRMPRMDGAMFLQRLRIIDPLIPVIVLTAYADVPLAVQLMDLGAMTVLEKPFDSFRLCSEVARAVEQTRQLRRVREEGLAVRQKLSLLSAEERAVMTAMVEGLPNKVIASRLALSPRTLDRRRQTVLSTMGIQSAAELATLAERHHLLS
ncbi:MAG: response regulator [Planctomycetales bacterium]|nr:response regulator [Planctomycetales bacterium]